MPATYFVVKWGVPGVAIPTFSFAVDICHACRKGDSWPARMALLTRAIFSPGLFWALGVATRCLVSPGRRQCEGKRPRERAGTFQKGQAASAGVSLDTWPPCLLCPSGVLGESRRCQRPSSLGLTFKNHLAPGRSCPQLSPRWSQMPPTFSIWLSSTPAAAGAPPLMGRIPGTMDACQSSRQNESPSALNAKSKLNRRAVSVPHLAAKSGLKCASFGRSSWPEMTMKILFHTSHRSCSG